ncbi:hypothetical protein BV25DRAFT_1736719 [Artomyces pyxidatus]|uniref:Uncharacterized protein n=1 Tax=Artomyces pyxidatus TaxID=48021 RepID=A0ACB8SIB4_9AGAM|nr:hypothetical protein BV25DRAFT_1736719 [Artomyces pyxidatus]
MDLMISDGGKGMEAETDRSDGSDRIVPSYWSACASSRLALLETLLSRTDTAGISGAYRRLDAEISDLEIALSSFRTRRNALSPIGRLPPEILVRIFSFDTTPDDGSPTYHLMRITHICRRWRSVAIGCPTLWGCINLAVDRRWAKVMLARAKAAPLSLLVQRSQDKMTEDDVALVVQHFPHIRNLHLLNRLSDDAALISKLHQKLTAPGPLLESFWLGIRDADHEEWLTLPQNIFDGHAPRLRRLRVNNFSYFPWQSPVLSCLVDLSISLDSSPLPSQSHPLDKILDALERMPALRSLLLDSCLPQASDQDGSRIVDLTRLSHCTLFDDICDCSQFLRSIRLHPDTLIEVGVQCSGDHGDDSVDTFLCVLMSNPCASHSSFPRLRFYTDSGNELLVHHNEPFAYSRIDAYRTLPTSPDEDENASLVVYFHLDYELPKYGDTQVVLETFCAMLPDSMDSVRRLDVHTGMVWTVDEWVNILCLAKNLTEIRAASESADTVCDALATVVEWHREKSARVFVCPKLSSLTLLSAILQHSDSYPAEPASLAFRAPQGLEKRRRSGLQLEHLHLDHCYAGIDQVRTNLEVALRRLVGRLTVTAPPRNFPN